MVQNRAFFRTFAVGLMSAFVFFTGVTVAGAEDVTFVMRNDHPNAVEVELYSQDRDHVWPGNNQVYMLDDGETKNISLACEEGESICYGAWISGDKSTYWGVGPDQGQKCSDCCYTCQGGSTEQINLQE